jgi:HemY protein
MIAQIHFDRLREVTTSGDGALLEPAWRDVPKNLARRADLVVAYARAAMACRRHDLAEKALRHLIDRQWDEQAVLAYGDLEPEEPLRPLETAEGWLRDRREDPSLLLSCGKLCVRAELYGKARSYLETSLAIRTRLETY